MQQNSSELIGAKTLFSTVPESKVAETSSSTHFNTGGDVKQERVETLKEKAKRAETMIEDITRRVNNYLDTIGRRKGYSPFDRFLRSILMITNSYLTLDFGKTGIKVTPIDDFLICEEWLDPAVDLLEVLLDLLHVERYIDGNTEIRLRLFKIKDLILENVVLNTRHVEVLAKVLMYHQAQEWTGQMELHMNKNVYFKTEKSASDFYDLFASYCFEFVTVGETKEKENGIPLDYPTLLQAIRIGNQESFHEKTISISLRCGPSQFSTFRNVLEEAGKFGDSEIETINIFVSEWPGIQEFLGSVKTIVPYLGDGTPIQTRGSTQVTITLCGSSHDDYLEQMEAARILLKAEEFRPYREALRFFNSDYWRLKIFCVKTGSEYIPIWGLGEIWDGGDDDDDDDPNDDEEELGIMRQ
jgi:hypothetical protein